MEERIIDLSLRMTQAYKRHSGAHPALREAMVLKEMYPEILLPLREKDVFAGRIGAAHGAWVPLDISGYIRSQIGYAINLPVMHRLQEAYPHRAQEIEGLIDYWKKETTFVKIREQAPEAIRSYLFPRGTRLDAEGYNRIAAPDRKKGSGIISGSGDTRIAGLMADYRKLMRLGIPGLRAEIHRAEQINPGHKDFYRALHMALDVIIACCEQYAAQADALAASAEAAETRAQMQEIAHILRRLVLHAPETLREGMQLMVMYMILSRSENHGRMDTYFGNLLGHDLEHGILDEESAVRLTMALWDVIEENGQMFDTRVLIGGMEREQEENADQFAQFNDEHAEGARGHAAQRPRRCGQRVHRHSDR